jgi:hypothetical protein
MFSIEESPRQRSGRSPVTVPRPRSGRRGNLPLEKAMAQFKALEQAENVLVLTEADRLTPALRKVALVWDKVPVGRSDPKRKFQDGPGLWIDVWEDAEVDLLGITEATGLDVKTVERCVGVLRGNRLIYPDGTLASTAQKALRQLAKNDLGI